MFKKGYKQSKSHRTRIGIANKGKIHSKEWVTKAVEVRMKEGSYIAWNKGKKYTKDEKSKLDLSGLEIGRKWNKGKKLWFIPKMAFQKNDLRISGENNCNWKGGITPKNKLIRQSDEYKLWRESVFIRDDFTCQECGQRGRKLQADHIRPFSLYPELRLSIDNGRTLCVECHRKIGWNLFRENNPREIIKTEGELVNKI